jgi:hypothetical protein
MSMPTMSARRKVPLRGQRVHFFNGQTLLQHQRGCREHHRNADAVGDEVGGVVGNDHQLAQVAVGEGGKGDCDGRIGFGGGDDFEQAHGTRRIEKMRCEETVAVRGKAGGDLADRQAGGIGGEHGMRGQVRHNAVEQGSFDGQIFCHCFDDPVAVGQLGQIVLEVAGSDERGQRGFIECGWFCLGQGGERGLRQAASIAIASRNQVKKERGDSCVGKVSGDARTHGSGAQHGGAAN